MHGGWTWPSLWLPALWTLPGTRQPWPWQGAGLSPFLALEGWQLRMSQACCWEERTGEARGAGWDLHSPNTRLFSTSPKERLPPAGPRPRINGTAVSYRGGQMCGGGHQLGNVVVLIIRPPSVDLAFSSPSIQDRLLTFIDNLSHQTRCRAVEIRDEYATACPCAVRSGCPL